MARSKQHVWLSLVSDPSEGWGCSDSSLNSQASSGCQAPGVRVCSGRMLWCGAGRWQCCGSATVESEIVRECYLQNDVPIERKCELMASGS